MSLLELLQSQVRVVESGFYADFEKQAEHRIAARDTDDWPVVALALALEAPIWTEDTDFFGPAMATWTTETVEIYLKDGPWQINEPQSPAYRSEGIEPAARSA